VPERPVDVNVVCQLMAAAGLPLDEARAGAIVAQVKLQLDAAEGLQRWITPDLEPAFLGREANRT
jgi:hypothetical protein